MIKVLTLCACFTISRSVTVARRPNLQQRTDTGDPPSARTGGCGTELEILVSPLVSRSSIKELLVYWATVERRPGDRVRLVEGGRVLAEGAVHQDTGLLQTGHSLGHPRSARETLFRPACSQIRALYVRSSGNVVAEACVQTRPTWMFDFKDHIKGLTLAQTFIPGTHNSGSYILSDKGYIETLATKYIYTQDETVLDQLILGGRYLDLRVGHYNTSQKWWVNHGVFPVHPLSEVLDQVKQFVNSTKEIVILDFHRFPTGFDRPAVHYRLAAYLVQELGPWLYFAPQSRPWNTTLERLWQSNRRIVLSYNNPATVEIFHFFPPIKQKWGDKDKLMDLEIYLDSVMPRSHEAEGRVWAAMAQLTPRALGVLFDNYGGLRKMADQVNRKLDKWLRTKGWAPSVVAVDFLRSTAVVSAAVRANLARARAPPAAVCTRPPAI